MRLFGLICAIFVVLSNTPVHSSENDIAAIKKAALDYIESQHVPNSAQMKQALHSDLKKRTYWQQKDGSMGVLESTYKGMIDLASFYNKDGSKFPKKPRKDVIILDIDQNVASVKLVADDWIDYMHMMKVDGKWLIINVLWQFHDTKQHNQ